MSENSKWFSQTLLAFKDKVYATDGYLRVSITTNTEDYKYFNAPFFNISVTNNFQKTYNLNIQNAEDLLESFMSAMKQLNGHETVIEKKYQKNTAIYFKFKVEPSNNERVVVIELISNENDFSKIIIPLKPTFQSFLRRLKFFVENYDKICIDLLTKSMNSEINEIIFQLPRLIKGISSQIVSQIPQENVIPNTILDSRADSGAAQDDDVSNFSIDDLDKFMGDDLENIKIPEIDGDTNKIEEKKPVIEINSPFIEKVLNNDLYNLESKITSFASTNNAFLGLMNDLQQTLGFTLLKDINEDDKKSLVFVSTLLYNYHSKMYTLYDQPITSGTPPLKYKVKGNEENNELAKDLLVIIGYLRTVRRKLESKINNPYDNKAMIYLSTRCFLDPYCFSFIENLTLDEILSGVKNRFNYFDSIGFFDKYKDILNINNCKDVELSDITLFTEETFEKAFGVKTQYIVDLHDKLYQNDMTKLPSKNTFNLEQIINEFLLLDIASNTGFDFKNKESVENLKSQNNITDEILNYFIGNKKVQPVREKITPLQRWVEKFKQDIPDHFQEEFVQHVKELQYNKFDFKNNKWPLVEFDDRIVKALYVWDPENNPEMKTNFTTFATLVETEVMQKENILSIVNDDVKTEKTDDWSSIEF